MNDTKRTILTGLAIGLLTLAIPFYLQLIGVIPEKQENVSLAPELTNEPVELKQSSSYAGLQEETKKNQAPKAAEAQSFFIVTDKYNATISALPFYKKSYV